MTVGILKLGQWCVSRLCVEGDKVWQFGGQYRMDVPTSSYFAAAWVTLIGLSSFPNRVVLKEFLLS